MDASWTKSAGSSVLRSFGRLRISLRQTKSRDFTELWIASLPRPSLSTKKTETFVCHLPWQHTEAPNTKQPAIQQITLYLDVKFVPRLISYSEVWITNRPKTTTLLSRTWDKGPLQLSLKSKVPCSKAPNATRNVMIWVWSRRHTRLANG